MCVVSVRRFSLDLVDVIGVANVIERREKDPQLAAFLNLLPVFEVPYSSIFVLLASCWGVWKFS